MLTEERRNQLDGIVKQMVENDESDENIRFVVNDFKSKYEAPVQTQSAKSESFLSKAASAYGTAVKTGSNLLAGAAKGVINVPYEMASLGTNIGDYLAAKAKGVDVATLKEAKRRQGLDFMERGTEVPKILQPQGTAQKIGFGAEKLGEFFVPVGASSKAKVAGNLAKYGEKLPTALSKTLGFGLKAGTEGAEMSVRGAAQSGGLDNLKTDFIIGAAMPTVGLGMKLAGNVAGSLAKMFSSKLSGVPTAAIEEAITNPKNVSDAIKKAAANPDIGPQMVLSKAEQAFSDLKQTQRDLYKQGLEAIQKQYAEGKQVASKLTQKDVLKKAEGVLGQLNLKIADDGALQFTNKTLIPKSYVNELQDLYERVRNWDDFTPLGLDDLREVLDTYYKGGINLGKAEKQFNRAVNEMRQQIRGYIEKADPDIAKLNKEYSTISDFIDTIRTDLSVGKDKPATAMRKLMNVFNAKSDVYRPVLDKLGEATGKDLKADIAGVLMSKFTPEGLGAYLASALGGAGGYAAMFNPAVLPGVAMGLAASSPRIVGKTATLYGKALESGAPKRLTEALKTVTKAGLSQNNRK